ncbi:shikimate dehydrogenase [Bradyrhizobium sp. DOA9]|uniref:shikimate dehydrogenase n=1 Tax=Bradyrhizobium sp. DOA9 TaxID=1126627 RepID=UPI000468DC58|nr:shikimate dehydrogenase [Bradyrhizobium sp. DOA9]GAJ32372.1 shikimate 5-dehydrogenase [Bradyrhizobium sp. DOA9]
MSKRGYAASKKLLTGLIGAPIAHSASPAMHERAAEALGLRGHYQLIEVAGADAAGLRLMLEGVRRLGFAGVNVTYPYKEAVVPLLDALAPGAAGMGAVNTVVARDGRLTGHNTDTTGFARAVMPLLAPAGNAIALIGAGGVGKAIAFALASLKVADIRVFDSEPARAGKLVALLASRGARVAANVEEALEGATGLVNGTPVGMLPNRDTPVPVGLLRADLWVADAVYSPLITPLLAAAREKGAKIMTGRDLAIYQAADAFELFTGLAPSTEIMGEAFDAVMAARSAAYQAA